MNIFAINTLNSKQYNDARELISACAEFDGTRGVAFLEPELNDDKTFPAFYMMYDAGRLISILSVFLVDENECEIYGYTLPEYRKQGYFKRLYKEAIKNIKEKKLRDIAYVCEPESKSGKGALEKLGFEIMRTEYLMSYDMNNKEKPQGRLKLISTSDENTQFYKACLDESIVGTCNVEFTRTHAVIYEFQIYEEFRGNGYGSEMLILILGELLNQDVAKILLHVNGANKVAHAMYSHHGFVSEEQIDYWGEN